MDTNDAGTGETDLYADYIEELRARLAAQFDCFIAALNLDPAMDVPAALGLPADQCSGEAFWRAVAYQPAVLTRLAGLLVTVAGGYLKAADEQARANEAGFALNRDLAAVHDAITQSNGTVALLTHVIQ